MLAALAFALVLRQVHTAAAQNSTLQPAVCTPDLCLQGDNSLTAGVLVTSPVNGSSQRTALLPGTYSSSSSAFANASSSLSSTFTRQATAESSNGFSTSGSLTSSFTVSLRSGLTAYSSPLFQGDASYLELPSAASNETSSSYPSSVESLLLTSNTWAIAQFADDPSSRLVVWDSIADVGELKGGTGSGGLSIVQVQARGCSTPCASGGMCTGNGTCACLEGFTGSTCSDCAAGHFGKSCQPCPEGCTDCDAGITGSGLCRDVVASNATLPSSCNCINGVCDGSSTGATCTCGAGWTSATNGTQCAACASGYYMSSSGDCRDGLQPLSSDATKCTTATTASSNGTFVTCSARTFWDASTSSCVECNPLCETCYKQGADGCLSCRSPNVLMPAGGGCVAVDSRSGVCNGAANGTDTVSGWVYDNEKKVCDALPGKCASGGIDNFSSASPWSSLTCSKCLPGSFLVNGACLANCPDGTLVSSSGSSCEACDSSCATCSTTSTFCTSCTDSSALVLNGTCISGPSCPTGYFASASNSTTACLACHPDCETCGDSFSTCLSCPSTRPVLTSSGNCVPTCAASEYHDPAKSTCISCSSSCATCSAAGSSACLSCSAGQKLQSGSCAVPSDGCTIIDGFGVCLEDLVTVAATSSASESAKAKWKMPWWAILVIVLVALALVAVGLWWFRKKEQKRRRAHTAKFARNLGDKEVDQKLATLPISIAYPPVPRASSPPFTSSSSRTRNPLLSPSGRDATHDIPLTPRFVLEDPASPISPTPSRSSYAPTSRGGPLQQAQAQSRWSLSSYGSKAAAIKPLQPEQTGGSVYSQRTFTTQAGNMLTVQSRNPFLGRL
ncbi:calcium-binding EGF-like domain-containing protein [Rhodotorula paludigena]|uniref:calcium-binding EGF-like domain-containing protein n=1 Tax=Rhodotorula paludigena TaxID=86838 RepID=UPI00316CEAAF